MRLAPRAARLAPVAPAVRLAAGVLAAVLLAVAAPAAANVINGADDRDSLLVLAPKLGLTAEEVQHIRSSTGFVACLSPTPSMGSGVLFLDNQQVLTAAHILYQPDGKARSRCFFRNQTVPPVMVDLVPYKGYSAFGAMPPKPGTSQDFAIVRTALPVTGGAPFRVPDSLPAKGETLIVTTGHPAGMAKEVDRFVPVAQSCTVRRVLSAGRYAALFNTDCDATGSSSGGANFARVGGGLVLRGVTISTGPWQDPAFAGAPYNEKRGSFTTAISVSGVVLQAGRALMNKAPAAAPAGMPSALGAMPGAGAAGSALAAGGGGLPGVDGSRAHRKAQPGN